MVTKRLRAVLARRLIGSALLVIGSSTWAQTLSVQLRDADGNAVADAVVEVILPDELRARFATPRATEVDQVDKEFVPEVSIVVAGSEVGFPNSDDILHHVYSFSPINTFDIPLYASDTQSEYHQAFPESGVVEIGCNIHDWMLAHIYVADSSRAAVSDTDGVAQITELPDGRYPLRVWHARLPRGTDYVMTEATITAGNLTEVAVSLELERDRRIRRAPSANRQRYR